MEMGILIEISNQERQMLETIFENPAFEYKFGKNNSFKVNLNKLIINLPDLINAKNQLDYLEELGVDNWCGYEVFDINNINEE